MPPAQVVFRSGVPGNAVKIEERHRSVGQVYALLAEPGLAR